MFTPKFEIKKLDNKSKIIKKTMLSLILNQEIYVNLPVVRSSTSVNPWLSPPHPLVWLSVFTCLTLSSPMSDVMVNLWQQFYSSSLPHTHSIWIRNLIHTKKKPKKGLQFRKVTRGNLAGVRFTLGSQLLWSLGIWNLPAEYSSFFPQRLAL